MTVLKNVFNLIVSGFTVVSISIYIDQSLYKRETECKLA